MAKRQVFALYICVGFLLFSCHFHHRWTEKEKAGFAKKCTETDTSKGLNFSVTGFAGDEIKSIHILHFKNNALIDSMDIYPEENFYDSIRLRRDWYIGAEITLSDTYKFIINGHKPYTLSYIALAIHPQFTMVSENYGCSIKSFMLDGVIHEDGVIDLKK